MYTLLWPAKSPDLNPIENIGSILARPVYSNRRQLASVQDLEETFVQCWYDTFEDIFKRLFESMQRGCRTVIDKEGGPTRY